MAGLGKELINEGLSLIKEVGPGKPKVKVELPDISELEEKLEELYPQRIVKHTQSQKEPPEVGIPVTPEVKLTLAEEQELRGLRVIIGGIQALQAEGLVLDAGAREQLASALAKQAELTGKVAPALVVKQEDVGTACDICSLDHISTCAGILEEANRFARRDGIGSPEVIRRISICRQQLNSMERDDANPQKLVHLPPLQRDIMEKILPKAGKVRHKLNEIVSLETLEQVTAEAQNLSDEFQNAIFRLQLKRELIKEETKQR